MFLISERQAKSLSHKTGNLLILIWIFNMHISNLNYKCWLHLSVCVKQCANCYVLGIDCMVVPLLWQTLTIPKSPPPEWVWVNLWTQSTDRIIHRFPCQQFANGSASQNQVEVVRRGRTQHVSRRSIDPDHKALIHKFSNKLWFTTTDVALQETQKSPSLNGSQTEYNL